MVKVSALLLGYENILNTNITGEYNKNIQVDKGNMYVFIFNKLYNYDSTEEYGKIILSQTTDSTTEEIHTYFDGTEVAFSPNKDGIRDVVIPCSINLRSAKANNIYVLDSNKNRVRTIATDIPIAKYFYSSSMSALLGNATPFLYDFAKTDCVAWDGMVQNPQSGKYEQAEEGNYYIQIESKVNDNSIPQVMTMPIKVDYKKPTIETFDITKEGNDTIITFAANDNVGISPYYYIDIQMKKGASTKNITFSQLYVETEMNSAGEYVVNLGNIGDSNVTCMVEDQAGNQSMSSTLNSVTDI